MGVKSNVFASKAEQANFHKLSRQWGDKFQIYHNLPFLNVFDTQDLFDFSDLMHPKPLSLPDIDLQRLKKTSIDYTLCSENKPLLCIEFDGLQDGYNVGIKYRPQSAQHADAWRQKITELKLKVAVGSLFPFFVVGSAEFRDITPGLKMTFVDGIIGEVIASLQLPGLMSEENFFKYVGYSEAEFETLDPDSQSMLAQDFVTDMEVTAHMENNPIWQKSSQLEVEMLDYYQSKSVEYVDFPDPEINDIMERIKVMKNAEMSGAIVSIKSHKFGEIRARVMLPNFQVMGYGFGYGLAEEMATIIVFDKLKRKLAL